MMNASRIETLLMIASGVLWLVMIGLAGTGYWFAAQPLC